MMQLYPEAAWDGHPCKHVADWEEAKRIERLEKQRDQHAKRNWRRKP